MGAAAKTEGVELWQIAPKLAGNTLREIYLDKKLFDIGNLVENLNHGLIGRIAVSYTHLTLPTKRIV